MIKAKYIMHAAAAVRPDMTIRKVLSKLSETGLPGLPVTNGASEVVGIVTEFDVLDVIGRHAPLDDARVEDIMKRDPVTADADTPDDDLNLTMRANNLNVIPIVRGRKLVGVVSAAALMDACTSHCYGVFANK